MHKSTSTEAYKLHSGFHAIRATLLEDGFRDCLDRPLAYWTQPTDRRLPRAFLGRALGDLLQTSFEDLADTPGIGSKKIDALIKLLNRVAKEGAGAARDGGGHDGAGSAGANELRPGKRSPEGAPPTREAFDPAVVLEAVWELSRNTVIRHGLEHERLGRIVGSLRSLPTVIWHTPLATYCEYSMAEVRQLRTHGEKRIRIVLEIFCSVHELLCDTRQHGHLSLRLTPKFIVPIEAWLERAAQGNEPIGLESVHRSLATPLIAQVQLDAGPAVSHLARERLGVDGERQTVRQQSRRMGVTRARIYQLLEHCHKVMAVRWPDGPIKLQPLRAKLEKSPSDGDALGLVRAASELFFPDAAELAARAADRD